MIRDATEADLPRILAITNEAIENTTAVWSLTPATLEQRAAWFRERRAAGLPVLVAEHAGSVAGFASYAQYRPWEGYLHTVEHSLYVDPAAQGRGLAKLLMAHAESLARAQGFRSIHLDCFAANPAALALYERLGYRRTGTATMRKAPFLCFEKLLVQQ